jgi:hypothetical protein
MSLNKQEGIEMKTYEGLAALIAARSQLPAAGWIFVEVGSQNNAANELLRMKFYVPENDDDEFFGEDNLATWLETGIFKDVLQLREKRLTQPSVGQYAEAAVHYRTHDDFLE